MTKISVNAGDKYGRLTIVSEVPVSKNKWDRTPRRFSCLCDCGKTKEVAMAHLRNGRIISCGCAYGTHFHSQTALEYRTWQGMKRRCLNPNEPGYKNYGGRGIEVCERWKNSYENFYADMGPKPTKTHTLERIDNNKGYCPENCKWATRLEQQGNVRTNRLLTYDNRTMCLAAWARELGVHSSKLTYRVNKVGAERAIKSCLDQ